jgi:hypothetical protein
MKALPATGRIIYGCPSVYTDAQWQKIEKCLGVDLDVTMVDEPCGPREWWGWEDYEPEQITLRETLQMWAFAAKCEGRPLTPKQYARILEVEVAALEKALAIVDPHRLGPGMPTFDVVDTRIKRRRALRTALTAEITERRQYVWDELEFAGSCTKHRARHTEYWMELTRLWNVVTADISHKRLRYFLSVCSTPLFPEATTDVALVAFTERYLPQMRK